MFHSPKDVRALTGIVLVAALVFLSVTVQIHRTISRMEQEDGDRRFFFHMTTHHGRPSEATNEERPKFPDATGVTLGIFSDQPRSFFQKLRQEVDNDDPEQRCRRYGFTYNRDKPHNRRLFLGGLIADEPWELLDITATESYGLYSGMVFVESNRTQNFTPRPFKHLNHSNFLQELFGAEQVQVRPYVNEDSTVSPMGREYMQREPVLKGWKELGMGPNDVGILADPDESNTRDFLLAIKHCDNIEEFDYDRHRCHFRWVGGRVFGRAFESSPECTSMQRDAETGEYALRRISMPRMMLGACIEVIGDESVHPIAKRDGFYRAKGWGHDCHDRRQDEIAAANGGGALWNALDLRMTCGGIPYALDSKAFPEYEAFTSFHLHNFFADAGALRFKYKTYGQPRYTADTSSLLNLAPDLAMLYQCVQNTSDPPPQKFLPVPGGFPAVKKVAPIYFQDESYRQRRHELVRRMVEADERAAR